MVLLLPAVGGDSESKVMSDHVMAHLASKRPCILRSLPTYVHQLILSKNAGACLQPGEQTSTLQSKERLYSRDITFKDVSDVVTLTSQSWA